MGFDMGHCAIEHLSWVLFNKPDALKHHWIWGTNLAVKRHAEGAVLTAILLGEVFTFPEFYFPSPPFMSSGKKLRVESRRLRQ